MFCVPVNLLCASRGRQHRLICHVFGLFICYLLPAERHTHTHTHVSSTWTWEVSFVHCFILAPRAVPGFGVSHLKMPFFVDPNSQMSASLLVLPVLWVLCLLTDGRSEILV